MGSSGKAGGVGVVEAVVLILGDTVVEVGENSEKGVGFSIPDPSSISLSTTESPESSPSLPVSSSPTSANRVLRHRSGSM